MNPYQRTTLLFFVLTLLFPLPVSFAYPNRPESYVESEKKWEEARSVYMKELDSYIHYLNSEIQTHVKTLDHGDEAKRSQIYEKFRDLLRERDKIRQRRSMMKLVTVTLVDDTKNEIRDTFKDLQD